ncbi:hypothetical protein [Peptoniphilus sp.]|jgi:hypothetical protein|uniref:hypothetical protein n=1 Tax=Peptoniphilus sp. TaxID=1971214 RepID=UPI003D92634E
MKYQNVRDLIKKLDLLEDKIKIEKLALLEDKIKIEKLAYLDLEKDEPDCNFLEITVRFIGNELCSLVIDEDRLYLTKNSNNFFNEDIRTVRDKIYEYFKEFVKENL